MTIVMGNAGVGHFPTPGNPQTVEGFPVPGSPAAVVNGAWPSNPNAAAGCIGTLTVNGVSRVIDLSQWAAANVVQWINGAVVGVVASVGPRNRLNLQSASGVPITIAGTAALLAALGLTAGTTVG